MYNHDLRIKGKTIKLNHLRGFTVTYLGPTNTLGSRVKITDTRHNTNIVLSFDYAIGDTVKQSVDYLLKQSIKIDSFTWNTKTNVYTIFSKDFATPLKEVK